MNSTSQIMNNLVSIINKASKKYCINRIKYSTFSCNLKKGIDIPKMMYGTAWKKEKTTDLVISAILAGFRGVDTACQPKHYREDLVGKALSILEKEHNISRNDLFIQTKFTSLNGQDPYQIPYDKNAILIEQVKQSFHKSLENLQTNYIDSLVMHSPMNTYEKSMMVWNIFEEFHSEGKVRFLGISNIYNVELLKKIWINAKIKPSIIQNRFYEDTNYDQSIRTFCRENGIVYQSFWTLTANPHILNSKQVKDLSVKYKLTPEQVFFKFVMQIGINPLTGTTNIQHMKQDLEVINQTDFSIEEFKSIAFFIKENIE
jgi:diketogulonate reductase-like aldo/keto reductase